MSDRLTLSFFVMNTRLGLSPLFLPFLRRAGRLNRREAVLRPHHQLLSDLQLPGGLYTAPYKLWREFVVAPFTSVGRFPLPPLSSTSRVNFLTRTDSWDYFSPFDPILYLHPFRSYSLLLAPFFLVFVFLPSRQRPRFLRFSFDPLVAKITNDYTIVHALDGVAFALQ